MTDWKETALWKHLETVSGLEAEAARALLTQEMPRIQTILTQAHTAPTDFTLHDADHSFRVAKWMAEIIPVDVLEKLSPYEITLLLLAAYLHDIGMTPEQGRVGRLWGHLVYGPPDPKSLRQPLADEEGSDLQRWLDDDSRDLTIPLAPNGAVSEEAKRLADLLIAHYCRHKHNDWSADWTRARLRREALPGYETWVDDLVQLCRSHHEGYDDLRQSRFDPRPAGLTGQPVHHRYLACVLRVADVLEIDPERTPEVIFRHREIHPGSVLYWRKDHENWIIRDGNRLVLTAYPESAVLENAIRRTADGIQQELVTCARLNREQPFSYWPLRSSQPLPHQWRFPEVLTVHVRPRNEAYVYIDGAFRPNTEKLLELLSGTQLYGNPLVAVRELLQNAFDAVKEEMAYQRLERPNDLEFVKHLAGTHRVELRLEERAGRQWLVCRDTGVGMTRRIIEGYLLVSGNSRRREIAELERRCQDAGFRLGRTGQFGIGVLSYFMVADRVEIQTRRSAARADAEATGWSFVTEGVGSFGELKKEPAAAMGADVRLRLREGQSLERGLKNYIEETVRHIPCTLELHGLGEARKTITWKAGWVRSLDGIVNQMLEGKEEENSPAGELLPAAKREKAEAQRRFVRDWLKIAREALRWRVEEGELPSNLGTYRIFVPWFELPGGRSDVFMLIQAEGQRRIIKPLKRSLGFDGFVGVYLDSVLIESIHGISLESDGEYQSKGYGFLEINWENSDAGYLRVDRNSLEASLVATAARKWAKNKSLEIIEEVLTEEPSEYSVLSWRLPKGHGLKPYWASRDSRKKAEIVWEPITFPAALTEDLPRSKETWCFRGRDLTRLLSYDFKFGPLQGRQSFRFAYPVDPDKLVVRRQRSSFEIVRLFEKVPEPAWQSPLGTVAQFPPEWRKVCGVKLETEFDYEKIWNAGHPVVSQASEDSERWAREIRDWPSKILDLMALGEDILATPSRAARVLAWVLETGSQPEPEDIWVAFLERSPSLAERLLHAALGSSDAKAEEKAVGFLRGHSYNWSLIVLTADSATVVSPGDPLFEEFLPFPGPEWVVIKGTLNDESA